MEKSGRHIISKSTFMYGCQCVKRFYLNKFKKELKNPEDDQDESLFSTGIDIGKLARGLFPGGISAEPPDPYSYHISVAKTAEYIIRQHSVIYEAAFNFEGVLCAIDILVKRNNKWYAFEVKGSNSIKEPYKLDTSLQHHVITKSGLPLEDISIIHFDKEYVRRGALEIEKLFKTESVLETVIEKQEFVEKKIAELKLLIQEKKEPIVEVGRQCSQPYECDFTNYCWANVKEEVALGSDNCDRPAIKEFLSKLEYPIFFFDFETIMPGVPEFDESRPYQQIPTQYSLHVQQTPGSNVDHNEFLGDGFTDPREELIKALLSHVGKKGTILVWYQAFEISRLNEMARDFPVYADELYALIDRIVDLIVPFKKGWYELPGFGGSSSLKAVLPVMMPELSYNDLEIQEGGTASYIYSQLKNQPLETQELQRKQLLEYCKLDTWAMVKILEKLEGVSCDTLK